jgi:hypothetical protein
MAASNKRQAKEQARSATTKWALGFASVAWIPGSHYVMTGGDLAMVVQVGSIYDVHLDKAQAAAIFTICCSMYLALVLRIFSWSI